MSNVQVKLSAKQKKQESKLKLREELLEAQKNATSELMEKARNVGLTAARLIYTYPESDAQNMLLFRRILANRVERSAQVGPVYAVVAERAYWAELLRLENARPSVD